MFETTSDKILKILIDCDNVGNADEKILAVKNALPTLSDSQIFSAVCNLKKENLILADIRGNEILDIAVQPYALSKLTDRRDFKIWNIKFDLIKIAVGYGLGFISAWLLK